MIFGESPLHETEKYHVRTFEEGDENSIIGLFNKQYGNYGGFVKRTPEYWFWSCLERPDVEREGVLVVVDENGGIVGYAVVGKSGNIWEFSYNPERNGERIVSLLFESSIQYLHKNEVSSLSLNASCEDLIVKQVCEKFGFSKVSPERMYLSVLNFSKLVSSLIKEKEKELTAKFNETVLIKLRDAPFWIAERFFIKISEEKIEVGEGTAEHTVLLEIDPITFSSLLFGIMTPFQALIRFKIKVKPLRKIFVLLRLLSNIKVETSWFFPLSDFG